MATLYVTEPGAQVEKEYQKLVVTKDDATLASAPALEVTSVALVGNIGVTTPAMAFLLERGIPLVYLNQYGKLRGRLVGATARNLELRHRQYDRARDADFCLRVSRAIVWGKLANSLTLARRMVRRLTADPSTSLRAGSRPPTAIRPQTAVEEIEARLGAVGNAADLGVLRGLEGAGTKAYFEVLRASLQHDLGFEKRARRPPPDPINALLSLGYTLLAENLFAALEIVGLDPYDGFYHADKYGRPALALDLMEEFRALIVDSVVLNLVNREIIGAGDFRASGEAEGGVYLNRNGLKKFFHQYSARLNTVVAHSYYGKRLAYLKCFEVQARLVRKVIEGELRQYVPFHMR